MATPPGFTWGSGGQKITTPQQAERQRAIAEALIGQSTTPASNWAQGLGDVAAAFSGTMLNNQASAAEEAGRLSAAQSLAGIGPSSDFASVSQALANPWLSQPQASVASALLSQNLERSDPSYQLDMAYKQAQLDALQNPQPSAMEPTSAIQNYEYLVSRGVDPATAEERAFGGGGVNVSVGGVEQPSIGTIPPNFAAVVDPTNPSGYRFEPIPGSQAERDALAASQATGVKVGQRDTVTDTIVNEANNVRKASDGFAATGVGNALTGGMGFTPAGQVNQSVNSLKAIAAVENVTAMRNASPTGAALGAASDKDLALLQDKAGALNPQSPTFLEQVDDYERTLLRIVHGKESGDRIFYETRQGPVKIGSQADYDAAPSGTQFIAPDGTTRVKP